MPRWRRSNSDLDAPNHAFTFAELEHLFIDLNHCRGRSDQDLSRLANDLRRTVQVGPKAGNTLEETEDDAAGPVGIRRFIDGTFATLSALRREHSGTLNWQPVVGTG